MSAIHIAHREIRVRSPAPSTEYPRSGAWYRRIRVGNFIVLFRRAKAPAGVGACMPSQVAYNLLERLMACSAAVPLWLSDESTVYVVRLIIYRPRLKAKSRAKW